MKQMKLTGMNGTNFFKLRNKMELFTENFFWYIAIIFFVIFIGYYFVDKEYYKKIQENTPFYTPPPIIFAIIWSLIYFISVFAFALIPEYFWLFLITMILNAIWTVVFFKYRLKFFSFLLIVLMLFLAIFTLMKLSEKSVSFDGEDNYNTFLLIQYSFIIYPIWLLFAGALTVTSGFLAK